MKKPSNIPHPLRDRTGTSQRTRVIEALRSDYAPIDGKTLADRLYMISKYAQQINYYEYVKNNVDGEYQDIDNWHVFFKKSLPFQLAFLSKTSIETIESEYNILYQELRNNPSKQGLESLLIFMNTTFITPVTALFDTTDKEGNSFAVSLLSIIKSSFIEPLKTFIALYNASATFLCITKKSFNGFLTAPWQLGVEDVYGYDVCIQQSKKGKKEAYHVASESINTIFYQFLSGFKDIVETAPEFIEEALDPLQESLKKRHQPHLGLLFAFLELFKNLQTNSNDLGKKHLDFFYQKVLKISPKKAVPDKAHIIFEIAKHLDEYLLEENLLLKNGKDVNKEDIQFGLDHEIVIDKAQITDLRTLSLPSIANDEYIEGVYIAPNANSVDGLGGKFKKDQSVNWSTLGSKYSKQIPNGNLIADEHPKARLGFVLSSPVLLLQEGKRSISIKLDCEVPGGTIFSQNEIDTIVDKLNVENEKLTFYINDQFIEQCQLLSLTAKEYLTTLLIKQNPYTISEHNLDAFLSVLDPVSCEPIFNESDKTKFIECLQLFYSINDQILEIPGLSDDSKRHIEGLLEKQNPYVIETSQLSSFFESDRFTKNDKLAIINYLNLSQTTKKISKDTLFTIEFSGEKEWLIPIPENLTTTVTSSEGIFRFTIQIELDTDFPAIVFYGEEKLKEKLDLKKNFPVVKIELNPNTGILLESNGKDPISCKLRRDNGTIYPAYITPYHFLKGLKISEATIDVEVCGVKNLIVQNDDNLQDVNKPIQPFGPRPKVGKGWYVDGGANFYIGSKEVFCKNWQRFWINTTWKDKPQDLGDHYKFYDTQDSTFEDGSDVIEEGSFRFGLSILEEGLWKKDERPKLGSLPSSSPETNHPELLKLFESFTENNDEHFCSRQNDQSTFYHKVEREMEGLDPDNFTPEALYAPKSMQIEPLQPLSVNTRKGFIRLTLAGVSFQHDIFTFVLTRQMMALADLVDPNSIANVQNDLNKSKILSDKINDLANQILSEVSSLRLNIQTCIGDIDDIVAIITNTIIADVDNNVIPDINDIRNQINGLRNNDIPDLKSLAEGLEDDLGIVKSDFDADPANAKNRLDNAITKISQIINDVGTLGQASTILGKINGILSDLNGLTNHINMIRGNINQVNTDIEAVKTKLENDIDGKLTTIENLIEENPGGQTNSISDTDIDAGLIGYGINIISKDLSRRIDNIIAGLKIEDELGLPREPYTPLIKSLSIDYEARAEKNDIDIIHLYPFENTSKFEDIEQNPTLFPFFNDAGTLFIGIENLTPGGNLSVLFQLAEATADSEMPRAKVNWHYLSSNNWIELVPDFNIISDETNGLTVSGIVTIAVPDAISKVGNTVMPDDLYWIKVSTESNAKAVAETIGIHTQAAKASARLKEKTPLTIGNDTTRLNNALEAGSISKLSEGDFSVKKVKHLYPSFDGRQPEAEGHFYVRVSEHLKHKGRALMLDDYEKMVLEGFPEIYKVKCISHTMGLSAIEYKHDLEIAPGYVVVTVIPDLTKLVSGNQVAPKVPVSLLEKIANHLRKKISPFARIKVMNPRYEYVDVDITVRLYRGKSTTFHQKQLKQDISNLLSPWFLGDSEKIAFGMPVVFSDVVGFVERLDYVDFIIDLKLSAEDNQTGAEIKPLTARSILTGGKICVNIDEEQCDETPINVSSTRLETINKSSELS